MLATRPIVLTTSALDGFRAAILGDVILPGDPGYDGARQVHNARFDRHPAIVVRVAEAGDVVRSIRFAREYALPIAVRSGGHGFSGESVVDDGLVIDLSRLKKISIDPQSRTATVQPGATSQDLAPVAHEYGLALTTGDVGTVGIGGLALGGGIGWFSRKYGLTIDHLLSVEVVTADGEILRAGPAENADLFWAVRGGGGNFGVVTSMTFKLHPGGMIYGGALVLPAKEEVLRRYLDYAASAPDELTTMGYLMAIPPAPFVPVEHVGKRALVILICCAGSEADGRRVLCPLRALAKPYADAVGLMPYPFLFRATAEGGMRAPSIGRSMFTNELDAELLRMLVDFNHNPSSPQAMIQIRPLGGAFSRVPVDATAFAHRDKRFLVAIATPWADPAESATHIAWTEQVWDAIRSRSAGAYVGFLEDEPERIGEAYPAATYARLAGLKRRYDPENVFALNQNIRPSI